MSDEVLQLTKQLIAKASVTPEDAGCQALMIEQLTSLGFTTEDFAFEEVSNFWSKRTGTDPNGPVFCFAGHTDVVPPGPLENWTSPPFEPTERDDYLYGRGAADMKASLAAMLVASKRFVRDYPDHQGSIAFLITSDEEGPFINGTTRVVDALIARDERLDYCLVGEPSSTESLGDIIKHGRRGSLSATLVVNGKQGHVAYPHLADNAIHKSLSALAELANKHWDQGNEDFPPSSMQITSVSAGTGDNVVPGELEVKFNFRYSTEQTADKLKAQVTQILEQANLDYQLTWKLNGEPFLTAQGELIDAVKAAIKAVTTTDASLSTAGGTSDGRFIAKLARQVIELGPINASIHQVNERVKISDLSLLEEIYYQILIKLLLTGQSDGSIPKESA